MRPIFFKPMIVQASVAEREFEATRLKALKLVPIRDPVSSK